MAEPTGARRNRDTDDAIEEATLDDGAPAPRSRARGESRREDAADREADEFARALEDEDEEPADAGAPAADERADRREKPALLRAIERLLVDPEELRLDVEKLRVSHRRDFHGRQLARVVADELVDRYARRTMLVGGATALAGVVPGLGTAAAAVGGAVTDAALSMKYEIELVQAIALAYGRDVTVEEERDACLLIAGVGTLAELGKYAGKRLGAEAFVRVIQRMLAGNVARFLFLVFRVLGLRLGPRSLLKAIPFGVGLGLNVLANRTVTRLVGARAIAYFESTR